VRGRPPRLAHLVPGSPAQKRRDRALAALLGPTPAEASAEMGEPGASGSDILCLPTPEWLPHALTVTGLASDVDAFRDAARGPGHIAWSSDSERDREAWTAQLLALCAHRPDLAPETARALAREMAECVAGLDLAAADHATNRNCPFDLSALVPLPARLLRRGPDDTEVVAWLWQHWGTTWMLRGVEEVSVGGAELLLPDGHTGIRLRFWSADWTPWRALASIRVRWPTLSLHVVVLPVVD
jgi:hypothetical protein